jgi:hypothetical protein
MKSNKFWQHDIGRLNMSTIRYSLLAALCGACLSATAHATELMVFPKAGQSAQQQEQDKFACYSWAKDQSGFDPMAQPTATAPPPQSEAKKGGIGRGAVRGTAVGAILGDAGKGAAAGAAVGGMRRQDQKRREAAATQQWEQEQQRTYAEKRDRYDRAYAACLEGKNYTVR